MNTPPRKARISKRLPLPVSIELYNFVPLKTLEKDSKRPPHSTALLHSFRLQLVVDENRIVYDQSTNKKTSTPCWLHVNEELDKQDLTVDEYESIVAKIMFENAATTKPPLLQVPIHPSKLSRIESKPELLPINAIVLQFSDESIRVPTPLYHILKEAGHRHHVAQLSSDRFEDDVFSTLDQVTPITAASLLETDDESMATPVKEMEPVIQNNNNNAAEQQQAAQPSYCTTTQDLLREQELLQHALDNEMKLLDHDLEDLQSRALELQACAKQTQLLQERTALIHTETQETIRKSQKAAFLLQAQQIRLFKELKYIYPISVDFEEKRYRIRGLEFPSELLSGHSVSDDELSAAMGALSHLILMMSKYLAVELRYDLNCFVSRSTIQDDVGETYPLYLWRNVDREKFEKGFHLLTRNVDHLCNERGVRVSPKLHVLAKVKRIYERVVDGF